LSLGKLRVGIVGVGNCASSFVQGLTYYRGVAANERIPGLMNASLGGYHVDDIAISSAFDVARSKVGLDLAEAIDAAPNNTHRFAKVERTGVTVERGPTFDGIGKYLRDEIPESEASVCDVGAVLKRTGTEIVVCYLPVGSQRAAEWYAERTLEAGCAFVNCIPVFIASKPEWRRRFESELESKKISKTQSVMSQLDVPLEPENVHVGPSDYVPWLTDRKFCHIRMEGTTFGGLPLNAEIKLEVWDSPNSAGIVIDAVRCAKLALDREIGGALTGPSSYFMKSPPMQFTDAEARAATLRFIAGATEPARLS
jgi:myo-inositol-1-phosphate synthase